MRNHLTCLAISLLVILAIAFMIPHVEAAQIATVQSISTIPTIDNTTGNITDYGQWTVILSLVFCFGFLFLGLKNNVFLIIDGIVWIIVAITVFLPYGAVFWLVGLGIGLTMMLEGAVKYG